MANYSREPEMEPLENFLDVSDSRMGNARTRHNGTPKPRTAKRESGMPSNRTASRFLLFKFSGWKRRLGVRP